MKTILLFSQITKQDHPIVGGKASKLAELFNSGFNVPNGFVITTNASKITDELKQQITQTLSKFRAPFAVRSSATAEDLKTASFAGQYDTFLNVKGEDIFEHIHKCQASLNTERAVFYRKQKGITSVKMAVIIQEMIQPDFAGVVFTIDPIHNKHILVETAPGLGEAVVSGRITPNDYFVNRRNFSIVNKTIHTQELDEQIVKDIAIASLQIERHFNSPQDIEFAVKDNKIFILQSRPITTL